VPSVTPVPRDRRQDLIRAVRRCIAQVGLDKTTVRMIAAEAGVSPGTVTYHFTSKEELLAHALLSVADLFDSLMAETYIKETDPYRQLLAFIASSVPDTEPKRDLWLVWLEFWNQASRNLNLSPLHNNLYSRWRSQVQNILEAGIQEKRFRTHDTELYAKILIALLDGLAVNCIVGDPEVSQSEMYSVAKSLIDSLLL
jgi:AcrR family transcriptional regulator